MTAKTKKAKSVPKKKTTQSKKEKNTSEKTVAQDPSKQKSTTENQKMRSPGGKEPVTEKSTGKKFTVGKSHATQVFIVATWLIVLSVIVMSPYIFSTNSTKADKSSGKAESVDLTEVQKALAETTNELAEAKSELSEAEEKIAKQKEEVRVSVETEYGTVYRTKSKTAPEVVWPKSEKKPEIMFPVNKKTGNVILGTEDGPPLVVAPGPEYKWIKVSDPYDAGPKHYKWAQAGRLYGKIRIDS